MIAASDYQIEGVKKIELRAFADERGFFEESYREPLYREMGLPRFVQDNHSYSKKGTLRGLHFQSSPGQAKLVSVMVGTIYDVFVDLRQDSATFGQWGAITLDASMHQQIYIPVGFAHGFAVLSDEAHVLYKVSSVYDPETEKSVRFDDPSIGIDWPIEKPILSERDLAAPKLEEALR